MTEKTLFEIVVTFKH